LDLFRIAAKNQKFSREAADMQRTNLLSVTLMSLLAMAGCAQKSQQAAEQKPAVPAASESPFRLTGSFKDIMAAEINPSAEYLWNSVSTVSDEKGVHEKKPQTDEDWLAAKHQAIILLEGTNLLLMEGRAIVKPGEKVQDADLPGINSPEQIKQTIDSDRATFIKLVHALHDAGSAALTAIENKDAAALSEAGAGIDTACENCHLKYWYPNSDQAKTAQTATSTNK
jgi:hypothetical protein